MSLANEFLPSTRALPTTERMQITLRLLRKGWTTAMDSAHAGGYMSLSQRIGELRRRHGMSIEHKDVPTGGGAIVRAYRLAKREAS